jgi:predicted amidohydrolase
VTPELGLVGYPPRDLVFKSQFVPKCLQALDYLAGEIREVPLLVGYVDVNESETGKPFRNAAALLCDGEVKAKRWKSLLPTYDVFDERRYFEPATGNDPIEWNGHRLGVTICEDIWTEDFLHRPLYDRDPAEELVAKGVDVIINLSASPYHLGKPADRRKMLSDVAKEADVPVIYCNSVGANDQLVFDGHSVVAWPDGGVVGLGGFEEECRVVDLNDAGAGRSGHRLERGRSSHGLLGKEGVERGARDAVAAADLLGLDLAG